MNKLSTAIAWHEESIREENEYAENDEAILAASQKSTVEVIRKYGKKNGARNNKMRTS